MSHDLANTSARLPPQDSPPKLDKVWPAVSGRVTSRTEGKYWLAIGAASSKMADESTTLKVDPGAFASAVA